MACDFAWHSHLSEDPTVSFPTPRRPFGTSWNGKPGSLAARLTRELQNLSQTRTSSFTPKTPQHTSKPRGALPQPRGQVLLIAEPLPLT